LAPETALALSLLKRGRDLVIGLPALGAWQLIESGRLWRHNRSGFLRLAFRGEPVSIGEPLALGAFQRRPACQTNVRSRGG